MQLETERLLIRPFAAADEPEAVRFFTDPDFMAWSPAGALSEAAARKWFSELIELYRERGFSKLALVEKASGTLIGYCGFGHEIVEGEHRPELGFRLMPQWRGRGYATEAARAVVADAYERLGMTSILALVIEENMPSRNVLEKLGMTFRRRIIYRGRQVMFYKMERHAT